MLWLDILLLLLGLVLVVVGSDILVDGSSSIARRLGVSEFVIGLTIVGMGTSAPEMVVSFIGAIKGSADIAVGNVIGSNIFNTLLILGVTSLILPIAISPTNRKRDIPINIAATLLLVIFGLAGGNILSRIDGAILLVLFIAYIVFSFLKDDKTIESEGSVKSRSIFLSILLIIGGIAGLIIGGRLFVNYATSIAQRAGVSDKFIAITILAGGTSLPELATCIVAAFKKKGQLALGNIIGSNIFNILLILGGSALITPLSFTGMNPLDLGVLIVSSLFLLMAIFTGRNSRIGRGDGIAFTLLWALYMASLVYMVINPSFEIRF
ncbi:MAG: calcium/sodium antiporter [Bacteroidales bacterium]|nr:calcium/sodium antiporter [Bacteroidales bacterium]